jgi:hypothetical protein
MGKISALGVLRLRATSAVSRDKPVMRSAQDDAFVASFDENILNTGLNWETLVLTQTL